MITHYKVDIFRKYCLYSTKRLFWDKVFFALYVMVSSQQQVRSFLRDFTAKAKVWDILFRDDRGKNAQTLLDLELRPVDRKKILLQLQVEDYCDGPLEDQLNKGPQMWVFGREVKTKDVYIKITMGAPQSSVICISFHVAEHRLEYPFKTQ